MSTARTVLKNTAVLAFAQVASIILGFLTLGYTGKYLGVNDFGVLNLALSITAIYVVFIDFGASTYLTREVARDRSMAKKYLGNIIAFKLMLTAAVTVALITLVNLIGYPENTLTVIYLLVLSNIFYGFTQVFNSVFQAYEKMEYQSFGSIMNSVLMLAGVLAAMYVQAGVAGFALVYVGTYLAVMLYSFLACTLKFVLPRIEIDRSFLGTLISETWPFGVSAALGSVYYYIGSIMLQYMRGDEAVGIFNGAYRLFLIIIVIPQIFNNALFPAMSRFFVTSADSLKLVQEKYFKFMSILAIPIAVGTTLLAREIIVFIYDPTYSASVLPLQILIWSAACIFLSCTFGCLVTSSNRQTVAMKIAAACMLVNVLANALLIPYIGLLGTSVASLATELTSLAVYVFVSSRIGHGISSSTISSLARISLASLVMGVFVVLLGGVHILILIPLAAALYFAVLYAVGGLDKSDIELIRNVVPLKAREAPPEENRAH
jgi:O-antigen/teichoic acid export membrane protein